MACSNTELKSLYFELPLNSDFQAEYQAPDWWFTEIDGSNFIRIIISPEEYTKLRKRDNMKYTRAYAQTFGMVRLQETGFSLNLKEDNLKLHFILEDIITSSVFANTKYLRTIRCIDYVRPERQDYKTAIANNLEPYTIRTGILRLDRASGSAGTGENNSLLGTGGINLDFIESKLRLV